MLLQLRMALLVLSLALPAGCIGGSTLGDCNTCAVPTDKPVQCPNCTVPPSKPPDLNDPGYAMTSEWHLGDAWDYYSNQSRYHSDRVTDEREANGTTYFLVEEAVGVIGNAPSQRIQTWFDATNWTRLNVTYPGGTVMTNFTPPLPERFLHNGSFSYNQSDGNKGTTTRWNLVVNAYFAGYRSVALPWGTTLAGRVEYRALRTAEDGTATREFSVRYPSEAYANDVQYQTTSGEVYSLVAARTGDRTFGTLIGK